MNARRIVERLTGDSAFCNEQSREKWLEQTLQSIPSGSRLLDAGAGTQRYKCFCQHLRYVAQDFAQYDGVGNGAGLQEGSFQYGKLDIVCDITAIPEPDASFDAIMCVEVLEHLPVADQAIREFARLVRPDGHLIMTVPFCSLTHFASYYLATGFLPALLDFLRMADAGGRVIMGAK